MPEVRQDFGIRVYGGLNVADQEDQLVLRSHVQTQSGYQQKYPAESPDLLNIDFTKTGIKKRFGSTVDRSLTAAAVADDEVIDGIEFVAASSGTRYEIVVGKKSIYISDGAAAFTQILDDSGAAYTHDTDVAKCSFAALDGHLFIGLDGSNDMQVFRDDGALDPPFANGNNYIEAYDTTAVNAINNVVPQGAYMVESIHERLCYSTGNVLTYYTSHAFTSSSGLWDSPAVDFYSTAGRVKSLTAFAPILDDSLNEVMYIGSESGFDVVTGFGSSDFPVRIRGAKAPINHRSITTSKNWLLYLTRDKNIYAINKTNVIDIGRRLKTDERDGPLDDMNITASQTGAFAFYSSDKEQAYFFYSSEDVYHNDYCIVCDLKLGEPVVGEGLYQYETRVRNLVWEKAYGDTMPAEKRWFSGLYQGDGFVYGLFSDSNAANQKVYKFLSSENDDDLDTAPVSGHWKSPIFIANAEEDNKQWMVLTTRVKPKGSHTLTVDLYIDRGSAAETSFTFEQYSTNVGLWDIALWDTGVWAGDQVVKNTKDIDLYSDALQWQYSNTSAAEPFEISSCGIRYQIGAEER